MKRNIIALSVAAALGAAAGTSVAAPTVKANGVGHVNIIPYFSAQGNNVTQIAITNTDTLNGKAVKVRFRGAEWSDDLMDFTVFLSPSDVFTGVVTNTGDVSQFSTSDGSCTLPMSVNQAFPTARLENKATGTLEGYIEIITMADIDKAGATLATNSTYSGAGYNLYTAITHKNGVAPCKTAGSVAQLLLDDLVEHSVVNLSGVVPVGTVMSAKTGQDTTWMKTPTSSLTSWARIIDTNAVKAYGVPATAVELTAVEGPWYFRQANAPVTVAVTAAVDRATSDRIFFSPTAPNIAATAFGSAAATIITPMYQYDLPDLSTAFETAVTYAGGVASAVNARNMLTTALQKDAVSTEYSTVSSIQGATDLVLTQPTRRYYYNYESCISTLNGGAAGGTCAALGATTPVAGTNYSRTVGNTTATTVDDLYVVTGELLTAYGSATTTAIDKLNRIGLNNLAAKYVPASYNGPGIFFNREEQYNASNSQIVVSPAPLVAGYTLNLKGEASVIGFNRGSVTSSGSLGAKLTMNDISVQGGYDAGWAMISTVSSVSLQALPIIGFTAINVAGGSNYGTTLPLRYYGATGKALAQ